MHSERAPLGLKIAAFLGLAFLHLPILLIFVYAFTTEDKTYQWPPPGFTLKWLEVTWNRPDVWEALSPLAPGSLDLYLHCANSWNFGGSGCLSNYVSRKRGHHFARHSTDCSTGNHHWYCSAFRLQSRGYFFFDTHNCFRPCHLLYRGRL